MSISDHGRIAISHDRIAQFEEESGFKFVPHKKLCDFCDCVLPLSWKSIQCRSCPTIYDICDNCVETHTTPGVCHQHKDGSVSIASDTLTPIEKEKIRQFLTPKVLCMWDQIDNENLLATYCEYCQKERSEVTFDSKNCKNYRLDFVSLRKIVDQDKEKLKKLAKLCESNDMLVQVENCCGSIYLML